MYVSNNVQVSLLLYSYRQTGAQPFIVVTTFTQVSTIKDISVHYGKTKSILNFFLFQKSSVGSAIGCAAQDTFYKEHGAQAFYHAPPVRK